MLRRARVSRAQLGSYTPWLPGWTHRTQASADGTLIEPISGGVDEVRDSGGEIPRQEFVDPVDRMFSASVNLMRPYSSGTLPSGGEPLTLGGSAFNAQLSDISLKRR
jgi:hypothetical protein